MNPVIRAKLDLIIAVTAFGTIGIFVRYIALPSSIIALVRGAVGVFMAAAPLEENTLSA